MSRTRLCVAAALLVAVAAGSATSAAPTRRTAASFRSYPAPPEAATRGAEPSIGINPRTGATMVQAGETTLRVDRFDQGGRGSARWVDVTPAWRPNAGTLDPILETDMTTGRTWVSHLELVCSRMAFTDDDGATWTPVPVGCAPGAAWDHQSVGAGPFPAGTVGATYPSAVYYCANALPQVGQCGVSRDGGMTFGPARPVQVGGEGTAPIRCNIGWGLHVARDGTVYHPAFSCTGGVMGVHVTEDAGLTWSTRTVPDSDQGLGPGGGIATDAAGTAYLVWGGSLDEENPNAPHVSVSRDKGRTWSPPYDIGAKLGLRNLKFPTAVAGDAGHAAVAFLGTTQSGDSQAAGYKGVWHLYVGFTHDGGRTWSLVNATPESPVQVGPICLMGIQCASGRNLLDFIDMAIDPRGHVVVAIADGCLDRRCSVRDSTSSWPTVVRQVGGEPLLRVRR